MLQSSCCHYAETSHVPREEFAIKIKGVTFEWGRLINLPSLLETCRGIWGSIVLLGGFVMEYFLIKIITFRSDVIFQWNVDTSKTSLKVVQFFSNFDTIPKTPMSFMRFGNLRERMRGSRIFFSPMTGWRNFEIWFEYIKLEIHRFELKKVNFLRMRWW